MNLRLISILALGAFALAACGRPAGSGGDVQKAQAVSALQLKAAAERRLTADAEASRADAAARAQPIRDATALQSASEELKGDAAKLDAGVEAAPDFGRQAADNTTRLEQLAASAPTLPGQARAQLAVSASRLIVGTGQVDAARAQYATGLDRIVRAASPLATEVRELCGSPEGSRLGRPCAEAEAAAIEFDRSLVHASVVLKGYRQTIQTELERQNALVQKIGG
jgi:predicted small secreted protein